MPMSRLFAGTSVTSRPPTTTRPPSTSSRPASARSAVVLPQPDGPSSATSAPGATSQGEPVERVHVAVAAVQVLEPDLAAGVPSRAGRRRSSRVLLGGGDGEDGLVGRRRGPRRGAGRPRATGRGAGRTRTPARPATTATEMLGSRLPSRLIATCTLVRLSRFATVNSPSTSATDRNDADRTARADVRQHDPRDHGAPARAQAARRLGQGPDVDRCQPRVDRAVGVREHEHGVREAQRQRRGRRGSRRPRRRPAPGRRRARSRARSAAAGRGTPAAGAATGSRSRTQIIVGHEQHEHEADGEHDEAGGGHEAVQQVRVLVRQGADVGERCATRRASGRCPTARGW